jgi:hypothetical protein
MTVPDGLLQVTITDEDVARLRALVGETTLTDQQLAEALAITLTEDGTLDFNLAAADVWSQKAAAAAELVDTAESGSSRKLSDIAKNALLMEKSFRAKAEEALVVEEVVARPKVNSITRG